MEAWKGMPYRLLWQRSHAIVTPAVGLYSLCTQSYIITPKSSMTGQVTTLEYSSHAISLRLHTSLALNCFVFKDVMTTFTFTLLLGNLIQEKCKMAFLHKLIEQFTLKD